MGKKGKGNKLAKMSEEERARYLQLRADIEEETRRRKMQLISLYMKNKLKREDAFCRLNMAKINQEWRTLLRQVKVQELRNEMLALETHFRDILKHKDDVLERLLHDLDVAEDQHATLQQTHMENIEKIIDLHKQRIDFFTQNYEEQRETVMQAWRVDSEEFNTATEKGQEQLECVNYQLEDYLQKQSNENHECYLQRVDALKSEMQVELEKITHNGETKLEKLWQEYQEVLSGYVSHTEAFYAEYVDLKERDEESAALIRAQAQESEKASEQLANLKLVSAEVTEKSETQLKQLQNVRNELTERLREVRKRVEQDLAADNKIFKIMSVESHNAVEAMKRICHNGETLLQLVNACSKLETEREKLFPLGLPPLAREGFQQTTTEVCQIPAQLKEHDLSYFPQMDNFWRRVNNVTVDVACLKQQKKQLEKQNAKLKSELQEHLINLNISNGCNAHINDYLAKRPSSMRVDRVTQMELAPKKLKSANNKRLPALRTATSCIEANLSNAVRSMELSKSKPKLAKIDIRINW